MKVLILGGGGMLGHTLCQVYRSRFDTWTTVRNKTDILPPERTLTGVDAFNFDTIVQAVGVARPDVVINCIGIVKQLPIAKDPIVSLTINSLLPHRLALVCQAANSRLIHISTDCVFAGRKGMYTEDDTPDADDLYGRSKLLGEVVGNNCLTLRTSVIGRELNSSRSLVEWFLSNTEGKVRGFTQAIYSGFTTHALADILATIIESHPQLEGLYHVSSEPISKYNLLLLLRDAFGIDVEIEPYAQNVIDRSLDSTRFRVATGFNPPDWSTMIHDMAWQTNGVYTK